MGLDMNTVSHFRIKGRIQGFTLGALLLFSAVASAEIYRWVDENGQVHYSDRPNPVAKSVSLDEPSEAPAKYVVPVDENADGSSADAKKLSQRSAEVRQEQCEKAKTRLASYKDAGSVVRRDEFGEETEVSAEDRVELIVKTEAQIEKLCTG